jgi:hypothetical protein
MPVRVPMDRAPFPPLRAQSEENEELEALAAMLIDECLEQYDHHQLQTYGGLRADWSPLQHHDGLDIYQHLKSSTTPTLSSPKTQLADLPRLLALGTLHAGLEDVMLATLAPTSEAMHVKMAATPHGDDIDGLVLHTVSPVLASEPFRYCGVKWLLRRAPTGLQRLVKKRDFVFLEATGIKVRPDGERIGYHLCHSIEFSTTPQLARRGIVRGKMAVCHFYRELTPAKVDVWAVATLNMQGKMWCQVAVMEGARAMAAIRSLPALAMTKKLMWFQENRPPVLSPTTDTSSHSRSPKSSAKCQNCGKASRWPWKTWKRCELCAARVCTACMESITVFPAGLDPRANRVAMSCCGGCVYTITNHNQDVYVSQSCLDPSQRGSAQSTGAIGEDIRPKYDKAPSKFLPKKKKLLRGRTCSGDSGTTLTSSCVSRHSTSVYADHAVREYAPSASLSLPPARGRRSIANLADTLRHLQAVADATYEVQQQNGR